jgi:peroxiredoxin
MGATIFVLTGALAVMQAAERPDWQLIPRLDRGQELVYRGSFTEEALGKGIQFNRAYRLEARVFVLDLAPQGADLALFTVLRPHTGRTERAEAEVSSVRLERVWLDLQGRIRADSAASLSVPLEGPATVEAGLFVEVPRSRVGPSQSWEVLEDRRPPQTWKVTGTETINGTSCLRLEGLQQSDDWDKPRADSSAWRRRDRIWLALRLGVAYRVERTVERHDPARVEPSQRSATRYELESALKYPDQMFEDRRKEILQARTLAEAATPLLPEPGKHGRPPFEALLAKITHHLDHQPPTPYREAILQVKRRVEAALRGESPPTLVASAASLTPVMAFGKPAPDFTVTGLTDDQPVQLKQRLGKPLLLVFFNPASSTAADVLRFAQRTSEGTSPKVTVLGLAVADDAERARQLHTELPLSFPLLPGDRLRPNYAVDVTPKLIVLDAEGVVRGSFIGWGRETATAVTEELQKCQRLEEPKIGTAGPPPPEKVVIPAGAPER